MKVLLILLTLFLSGCIEDVVDSVETRFSNSSDLITYAETRTTLFNQRNTPLLVSVDELNRNIGEYHILDIRDNFDFQSGHVQDAKNVQMKDVLNYLKEKNLSSSQKIIIISNTGQLASYVSSLLIIAGFENIYSLDGGMTYWNKLFSDEMRDAIGTSLRYIRRVRTSLSSENTSPPDLYYENNPKTIEEKIEERVQLLLNESPLNIFISTTEFDALYSVRQRRYVGTFVVYAKPDELTGIERYGIIDGPISTHLFVSPSSFTSEASLLSLPTNLNIVLYSNSGQQSAYMTAYLKLLGYSAKSIRYGKSSMMCLDINPIYSYKTPMAVIGYDTVFCAEYYKQIRDYQYEVGE